MAMTAKHRSINKKIILAVIIVILVSILSFVVWSLIHEKPKEVAPKPNYDQTVKIQMDYPGYKSLENLKSRSDYIFIGQPMDNGEVVVDTSNEDDPYPLPETHYTLKVTDVIKGEVGKKATLIQTGGVMDGVLYTAEDEPQIEYGKTYIVFAVGSDGEYGALAGGNAVSEIKNGSFKINSNVGFKGKKKFSIDDVK